MVVDLQELNFHDLKWMSESKVLRFQGCFFFDFFRAQQIQSGRLLGVGFVEKSQNFSNIPLEHTLDPPKSFYEGIPNSSFWEFGHAY